MLNRYLYLPMVAGLLSLLSLGACQLDTTSPTAGDSQKSVSGEKPAIAASVALNPPTPPGFSRLGTINWQVYRNCLAYTGYDGAGTLHALENGILYTVDQDNGSRTPLGTGRYWANGSSSGGYYGPAMTSLQGQLYVVANSYLYRVNPGTGEFTQLGGRSWDKANFISGNWVLNKLYIMHRHGVYEVNPSDGSFKQLTGGWFDQATGFASYSRYLHPYWTHSLMVIHAGRWYEFEPKVLASAPPVTYPIDYGRGQMATNFKSIYKTVYAVRKSDLVETSNGGNDQGTISAGYWGLAQAMICGNGNLFIISDGALFKKALPY